MECKPKIILGNCIPCSKERRIRLLQTGHLSDCEFLVTISNNCPAEAGAKDKLSALNQKDNSNDDIAADTYKRFRCHKMILATASEVFERMLYGEFKEQCWDDADTDEGIQIVNVNDVSAEIFELFLKYVYIYELDVDALSMQNISEMLYLADKYMMRDLTQECVNVLKGLTWRLADILPIYELACLYEDLALMLLCYDKIHERATALLEDQSFYALSVNNLKRIVVLLSQDPKVCTNKILTSLENYGRHNNLHNNKDSTDFHKLVEAACLLNFNKLSHNEFVAGPTKSYLFKHKFDYI